MKFKAKSTFTVFHNDQMHVFNAGKTGELPDGVIAQYVEAGIAEELKGKAAKAAAAADAGADDDAATDAADAEAADAGAPPV